MYKEYCAVDITYLKDVEHVIRLRSHGGRDLPTGSASKKIQVQKDEDNEVPRAVVTTNLDHSETYYVSFDYITKYKHQAACHPPAQKGSPTRPSGYHSDEEPF